MKILREKIEKAFRSFTLWVYEHPLRVLIGTAGVIAFLIIQLPQLTFDVTLEGQFRSDDPTYENYLQFKKQYGDDASILVGVKSDRIFSAPFLEKLTDFHNELDQNTPYLDEIASLINITYISADEDELIVEDLLTGFDRTEEDLQKLKETVMSYPAYQDVMISRDGTYTLVYIIPDVRSGQHSPDEQENINPGPQKKPSLAGRLLSFLMIRDKNEEEKLVSEKMSLSNQQREEIVAKVREIAAKYDSEDFSIFITGQPVILQAHLAQVQRNMPRSILFTAIGILILMLLIFRRITPIILTLLVVICSLISVFGICSIVNIPVRTSTLVYPPIILVAGVCDAIHLFTIFFQQIRKGENKKQALSYAMEHSGLAMVFTSLTTIGGFLAFGLSDLAGIAELGLCAAIGVFMALILTFLLIPALLALLPVTFKKMKNHSAGTREGLWEKSVKKLALFSVKKPFPVLLTAAALALVSLLGASRITMSFDVLSWLPDKDPVKTAAYKADEVFRGGSVLEVVIDTGRENGLFDPQVLKAIEEASAYAEGLTGDKIWVGKTISIVQAVKQINKVLNENRDEFYRVPSDRNLIAQELFLFEMDGKDDLEDLVDINYSQARLTLRVPSVDGADFAPFREQINSEFERIFAGKARFYLTGSVDLFVRSVWGLMNSMTSSYILAAVVITVLLLLLTASVPIGLVGMIPNFFPILIVLGIMGFTGIPISIFSVLLGGIALGLAVDDTIHLLYNFRRNFDKTGNVLQSVEKTLEGTGKALFYTTLCLSIGFLAFTFSDMQALVSFGFLTGVTVVIALVSDLTVTPALMTILYSKQASKIKEEKLIRSSITEKGLEGDN